MEDSFFRFFNKICIGKYISALRCLRYFLWWLHFTYATVKNTKKCNFSSQELMLNWHPRQVYLKSVRRGMQRREWPALTFLAILHYVQENFVSFSSFFFFCFCNPFVYSMKSFLTIVPRLFFIDFQLASNFAHSWCWGSFLFAT